MATRRSLVPQRYRNPRLTADLQPKQQQEVEIWDSDPEFDFQDDQSPDLFRRLSSIERDSTVMQSSDFSQTGRSFEQQLEALQFSHPQSIKSDGVDDGFESDFDEGFESSSEFENKGHLSSEMSTLRLKTISSSPTSQLQANSSGTLRLTSNLIKSDSDLDRFREMSNATIPTDLSTMHPPSRCFNNNPLGTLKKLPPTEDFETDFDLPDNVSFSNLKIHTSQASSQADPELDMGWGEDSTSTRYTNTRWTDSSNRSSVISAFSTSSSVTCESENEGLLGIQIPNGPLNFQKILDMKMQSITPASDERLGRPGAATPEEFLDGIEIGDDDRLFDSDKSTINRNIKHTSIGNIPLLSKVRTNSPKNISTFTPKPTRIPRPVSQSTIPSNLGTLPAVTTPQTVCLQQATDNSSTRPENRRLSYKSSILGLKGATAAISNTVTATSTTNQPIRYSTGLLTKKSMPTLRSAYEPGNRTSLYDSTNAPPLPSVADWLNSTPAVPSLKQNSSSAGLRNVASSQNLKGTASRNSMLQYIQQAPASTNNVGTPSRPKSTTSGTGLHRYPSKKLSMLGLRQTSAEEGRSGLMRESAIPVSSAAINALPKQCLKKTPSPPQRHQSSYIDSAVRREAPTTKTLLKPVGRQLFGDGTELDNIEDLQIAGEGTNRSLNSGGKRFSSMGNDNLNIHPSQERVCNPPPLPAEVPKSRSTLNRNSTRSMVNLRTRRPLSSYNAAQETDEHALPKLDTTSFKIGVNKISAVPAPQVPISNPVISRTRRKAQHRPHLIRPLGDIATVPRQEKGMKYNPHTFTWEGNESVTAEFNNVTLTPPSRPALISNITATKGVQVVGGMVFDPARMCWFNVSDVMRKSHSAELGVPSTSENQEEKIEFDFDAAAEAHEDPFAGFDEFGSSEDESEYDPRRQSTSSSPDRARNSSYNTNSSSTNTRRKNITDLTTGDVYGEFVVGEEFDVGPAFIRKQMEEEDRWRRKVRGWMSVSVDQSNVSSTPSTSALHSRGPRRTDRRYLFEIWNLTAHV
ncbi:uncharacterized protein V1516DRAFT_679461 [Lipomyces oligophaga]|uniref:uncharacterized protein n=1 Tax=Lipomyces oligophaga TaxID=45792 RepID=UPI0034CFE62B